MFYLTVIFHHYIVFIIKNFYSGHMDTMKSFFPFYMFKLFFLLCVFLLSCTYCTAAESLREPVYAGSFYPDDREALTALIEKYTRLAGDARNSLPADQKLFALILPHAGYPYSGPVAAHAIKALENQPIKKIILMGPDHRIGFFGCAVPDASFFRTPLGDIPVHPDAERLIRQHPALFKALPLSADREHCLEVVLPFLQHSLHDFQIIPLIVGKIDPRALVQAVDAVRDSETLVVASSDLSHYLPYDAAKQKDEKTLHQILNLDAEQLAARQNAACGTIPIQALILLARRGNWQPEVLQYANSGDTAGPKDRVVGYAAIAFYEPNPPNFQKGSQPMDKQQGDVLLKVARKTLAEKLRVPGPDADVPEDELSKDIFNEQRGTFVTLKINDQLRGCIGNLLPDKSILDGVRDNAVNAAFHDPRFPPLSKDELERVDIEISLLTRPEPLEYKDSADLLTKLRPGVDGLIIRKGPYSATFLPQVWDQLPDKKAFLSHLCAKAGLSPDAWQQSDLEVMTYQVQYFEEPPASEH